MNWFKKKYFDLTASEEVDLKKQDLKGFTLVLSSFSREENVKKIVKEYDKYSCFDELIIWHNGPRPLKLSHDSSRIRIIHSDDMGLASRYSGALLADSQIIFLHDDDLILPESSFMNMADLHVEYGGTVSIEGKNPHSDGSYGRSVKPKIGEKSICEIHLNRCICTSRATIPFFFSFLYKTNLSLIPSGGGGEDIVYSYAARLKTGKKPMAIGLPFTNLGKNDAISSRFGNQHKNRTKIMKVCQRIFDEEMSQHGK